MTMTEHLPPQEDNHNHRRLIDAAERAQHFLALVHMFHPEEDVDDVTELNRLHELADHDIDPNSSEKPDKE